MTRRYRQLAAAVVLKAVEDCNRQPHRLKSTGDKDRDRAVRVREERNAAEVRASARAWFRTPKAVFWCEAAGFDSDAIASALEVRNYAIRVKELFGVVAVGGYEAFQGLSQSGTVELRDVGTGLVGVALVSLVPDRKPTRAADELVDPNIARIRKAIHEECQRFRRDTLTVADSVRVFARSVCR